MSMVVEESLSLSDVAVMLSMSDVAVSLSLSDVTPSLCLSLSDVLVIALDMLRLVVVGVVIDVDEV